MSLPVVILPVSAAVAAPINAGDVGVTIQIPADIIESLTGATCNVVIVAPNGVRSVVAVTVSDDGSNATFETVVSTFPMAGTYDIQLEATFSSPAAVVSSSIFPLTVGKAL